MNIWKYWSRKILNLMRNTCLNVLRTHPFTIRGGIITQNPYLTHPDIWLAQIFPVYMQ